MLQTGSVISLAVPGSCNPRGSCSVTLLVFLAVIFLPPAKKMGALLDDKTEVVTSDGQLIERTEQTQRRCFQPLRPCSCPGFGAFV